ncbi:hypothetical protein DEU56DRAFT_908040 [Suillus clintonianus]|uniref:uncharacterized protein n=1 Tax=Suillus clintonianus TaxID=1904413 RepID=UPI001B880867|nr:uncharacterized protein DEU56DRAFT_908040 [Suillus clintonianus]KAG2152856.1 hypothetical protein DEU56DRAFT_908040 [Suillus clintonianus]
MSQSPSPSDSNSPYATQNALKRRIAALEEQNAELQGESRSKNSRGDIYVTAGRAIRRLVSLTDRIEDLVGEHDRRSSLCDEDDQHTEEEEQLYQSFQQLLRWVPCVRNLLNSQSDGYQLNVAFQKLNRGADSARGDDASSLKKTVASWLNESRPTPDPPITSVDKSGRGFYHDTTGELLCPVDFNWVDPRTKEGIRNYEPDFQVTAHSWPAFLYSNGKYDRDNPMKGLFKSVLLVRTFKHIFTSPSSAGKIQPDEEELLGYQEPSHKRSRTSGERRTRSNIATILGMRSVQARAIAYSAVQLRFALSSCGAWRIIDDEFDHRQFYIYIIDYFEQPPTSAAKASIDALLVWWNRTVFGARNVSTYLPQNVAQYSVANTSARRRQ